MAPGWLIVVALVVGFGFGIGVSVIVVRGMQLRRSIEESVNPSVPAGLARVVDAMGAEALVTDNADVIVRVSALAAERGYEVGRRLEQPELVELIARLRADGEAEPADFRDAERELIARAVYVSPRHTLIMIEDVTEARRVEALRRDFIANVSHELKTPIGAMAVLSEAIASAAEDPERVRAFAGQMSAQAERLTRLTLDVIALDRVQHGDRPPELKPVRADDIVEEAIDRLRITAGEKGIALVRGKRVKARVLGDRESLVVAVGNLIGNAIRYSPERSRVGIGVTRREGESIVEIAVTDQGIGIPKEEQERIFERFYRVDSARSRSTGGTGLGLSIVKHTVQNHGGTVTLWSMPGAGSTFTIRLPEYRHNEGDLREKRGRDEDSAR